MSAVDRAAEVIRYHPYSQGDAADTLVGSNSIATSLHDAGLLRPEWATDEAKALLDRLVHHRTYRTTCDPELNYLFDAYLASIGGES